MTPVKRRVPSITTLVAILGAALAIGSVVMHAGRWTGQVQGNTDRIEVHEEKIDDIEAVVIETHAIVTRIDKRMDREHP